MVTVKITPKDGSWETAKALIKSIAKDEGELNKPIEFEVNDVYTDKKPNTTGNNVINYAPINHQPVTNIFNEYSKG